MMNRKRVMQQKPVSKRATLYRASDVIITLNVGLGPTTTKYQVHKSTLCHTSTFFQSACKPEWMKPEEMVIKLLDDDREAIHVMVQWMYYDELTFTKKQFYDFTVGDGDIMDTKWGLWVRLYVLGDKYDLRRLQNHVMDVMIEQYIEGNCVFPMGVVNYVYEHTTNPKDALRSFLVDVSKINVSRADLIAKKEDLHKDFFVELSLAFMEAQDYDYSGIQDNDMPDWEFCHRYHVHDDEKDRVCTEFHAPAVLDDADN